MAKHSRKHPFRRLAVLAVFLLVLVFFFRWENTALQIARFDPVFTDLPAGFDGCRIVVLSDLHGAEFGEDNQTLFQAVADQSPEYIFYLGDLEDKYRGPEPGYAEAVAAGLTAIAPTYLRHRKPRMGHRERAGIEGAAGRPGGHGPVQ